MIPSKILIIILFLLIKKHNFIFIFPLDEVLNALKMKTTIWSRKFTGVIFFSDFNIHRIITTLNF